MTLNLKQDVYTETSNTEIEMNNTKLQQFKTLFNEIKNGHVLNELALETVFEQKETGDECDMAQEMRERQLLLKLKGRQNFYLKKVEQALIRIENGNFGECRDCGHDIEETRLRARPTATMCITCKEEEEREEVKIPYHKRSHTNGNAINNSNVIPLRGQEEILGEGKYRVDKDIALAGLPQ